MAEPQLTSVAERDSDAQATPVIDAIRSSGIIDTDWLLPYRDMEHENSSRYNSMRNTGWNQLVRLNKRPIHQLSNSEYETATIALQALLGLDAPPRIASSGTQDTAPHQSMKQLNRLRLGQPDRQVMMALSPEAARAVDFLVEQFQQRQPIVRMVAGEMGQGKTTLARDIMASAASAGIAPAIFNIPRDTVFDTTVWARAMVLCPELLQTAIQNIAQRALLGQPHLQEPLTDCFTVAPLSSVMATTIAQAVQNAELFSEHAASRTLARECHQALTPWLTSGYSYITPGKEFMQRYSNGFGFSGRFRREQIPAIVEDFLAFYREAGVYPVWMFDEFESIAQLTRNKVDVALGFFRDVLDAVASTQSGALLMFSTGDGVACLRQYPALEDRLASPDNWTMASPTWQTQRFCKWDASHVFEVVFSLYEDSARGGDPTSQAVVEHKDTLRAMFHSPQIIEWMQEDSFTVPRERLKTLVAIFDSAIEGSAALEKQIDAFTMPEPLSGVDDAPVAPSELPADLSEPPSPAGHLDSDRIADGGFEPSRAADTSLAASEPLPGADDARTAPFDLPDDIFESLDSADDAPAVMEPAPAEPDVDGDASTIEDLPGFQQSDRARDSVVPADRAKEMLTSAGYARWEYRVELSRAAMPFDASMGQKALSELDALRTLILKATSYGRLGLRLACFRDAGGLVSELWETLQEDTLALRKHETIALLENTENDLAEMNRLFGIFMEQVNAHNGVLPVATTETRVEQDHREALEKEDATGTRAFQRADIPVWPYMRDKVQWPEYRKPSSITPLDNIQVFRHALYTWFVMHGNIPSDEWVDQTVIGTLKERFEHTPRTSRSGVQFIVMKRGLLGRRDRRRSLSPASVEH